MKETSKFSVEIEDSFSSLLEFAANNDIESFRKFVEYDISAIDKAGIWYLVKKGSKQISEEERTPLMVASTYGSIDVLKFIVSLPEVDLNRSCGRDKWTALHCATFGGSVYAFDVVKLLLSAGADPNVEDAYGRRPIDVIIVPPNLPGARADIQDLLSSNSDGIGSVGNCNLRVSVSSSNTSSPVFSSPLESRSPSSILDPGSPVELEFSDVLANSITEKKQYPVDPSLPDIRNGNYSTDEFRMFSFKIKPCSRAYSHDWTECPFVHPGENARRRDPRKFHYSCVPCPEFRKGACRRGDMCEYAHGVFECWLHPAQYRTRLCKDRNTCSRQVCFFAHAQDELRPLYISTGSGVPSPRSATSPANYMDMATALSLLPCSPSSHSIASPVFDQNPSPISNGMPHSPGAWSQPNVPTLHLPGNNLQSSRLRSSISARDIQPDNQSMVQDFDTQQQMMNDLACFSQLRSNSALLNRSSRPNSLLTPSNLEELFMTEFASPRFSDPAASSGVLSPTFKSALRSQFQQQQNTYSPRIVEHPLLQASSPRMSPRSLESASPTSTCLSFANRENQQLNYLSSRDPGSFRTPFVGSPSASWSNFGGPSYGKVDWSVNPENSVATGDEPDLSWVQSLVKEASPEMNDEPAATISVPVTPQIEAIDHSVLGAWLEQMQLDQLVA